MVDSTVDKGPFERRTFAASTEDVVDTSGPVGRVTSSSFQTPTPFPSAARQSMSGSVRKLTGRMGRGNKRRMLPLDEYKARESAWLRSVVDRVLAIPTDEVMPTTRQSEVRAQREARAAAARSRGASSLAGAPDPRVEKVLAGFLRTRTHGLTGKACTQLVNSVANGGRPELALEVFKYLAANGYSKSIENKYTFSAAISAASSSERLTEAERLREAKRLFNMMKKCNVRPDRVLYNTMIVACSRGGQDDEATSFFDAMVAEGIEPDTYSYNAYVNACARSGDLTKALSICNDIKDKDAVSYCNMIMILGKLGRTDDILETFKVATSDRRVFSGNVFSNVRVYNASIYALSTSTRRGCDAALSLLNRMQEVDGLRPRTDTYNSLLAGFALHRRAREAVACLDLMLDDGVSPDKRTYTMTINACGRAGEWDMAVDVFRRMRTSGVASDQYTYSALIVALATGKLFDLAESMFQEMRGEGLSPNTVVYNSLIAACDACEMDSKKAMSYFDLMRREGMLPDLPTCERLLGMCERDELWSDARRVLEAIEEHRSSDFASGIGGDKSFSSSSSSSPEFELFFMGMSMNVPEALSKLPAPLKDAASAVVESGRRARDVLEKESPQDNPIVEGARLAFQQGRTVRRLMTSEQQSLQLDAPPSLDANDIESDDDIAVQQQEIEECDNETNVPSM